MALRLTERHLVRLYMAGCLHKWSQLPPIAKEYYAAGGNVTELRGCVRHMIV
jgi:hypothetical protein